MKTRIKEEMVIDAKKYDVPVSSKLIGEVFSDCYDYTTRLIAVGGDSSNAVRLCYIEGLVSGNLVAENVIKPITDNIRMQDYANQHQLICGLYEGSAYAHASKLREKTSDVLKDLLNGFCAVIFDNEHIAVTYETRSQDKRGIEEPKEEKVVKGSKDSFGEILRTNTSLVRRKLKNTKLKMKQVIIGAQTETMAVIVYMDDYTDIELVDKVEKRLITINTDEILTAGSIEDYIVDNPITPFPQLITTERPDRFCLNILEGRVGIIIDGLPIGFLAPGTFAQYFKVPEDRSNHFIMGSAMIVLRYTAMIIALFLPAFYVAVAMYHQEMLPVKMIESIIQSKQSVPFPTSIEVIMMLLAFELLQEAGLRLPSSIGQTVSIIGALIVGQSAVEAKVISPIVVIVVALTGIAGYTMPNQDMGMAMRITRFLLVVASILTGMFGLMAGIVMLVYHLCSLECFGIAYMTPFADSIGKNPLGAFIRMPTYKGGGRDVALVRKRGRNNEDN